MAENDAIREAAKEFINLCECDDAGERGMPLKHKCLTCTEKVLYALAVEVARTIMRRRCHMQLPNGCPRRKAGVVPCTNCYGIQMILDDADLPTGDEE